MGLPAIRDATHYKRVLVGGGGEGKGGGGRRWRAEIALILQAVSRTPSLGGDHVIIEEEQKAELLGQKLSYTGNCLKDNRL